MIIGSWLQTRKYCPISPYYQAFKAVSLESTRPVFACIWAIYFELLNKSESIQNITRNEK